MSNTGPTSQGKTAHSKSSAFSAASTQSNSSRSCPPVPPLASASASLKPSDPPLRLTTRSQWSANSRRAMMKCVRSLCRGRTTSISLSPTKTPARTPNCRKCGGRSCVSRSSNSQKSHSRITKSSSASACKSKTTNGTASTSSSAGRSIC